MLFARQIRSAETSEEARPLDVYTRLWAADNTLPLLVRMKPRTECDSLTRTEPCAAGPPRCGGFTLIELMMVTVIVGLLAGLALPEFEPGPGCTGQQVVRTPFARSAASTKARFTRFCLPFSFEPEFH